MSASEGENLEEIVPFGGGDGISEDLFSGILSHGLLKTKRRAKFRDHTVIVRAFLGYRARVQ
jgi:hypothetical protein